MKALGAMITTPTTARTRAPGTLPCPGGDCESAIIYDSGKDKICIVDQGGGFCGDEGIHVDDGGTGEEDENNDGSDGEGGDEEADYDDDADSGASDLEEDGDDEDDDDDDESDCGVIEEDGMIAQYDTRPAADVLRDINRWYRQHETPFLGRGGYGPWLDIDEVYDPPLAALYKQQACPTTSTATRSRAPPREGVRQIRRRVAQEGSGIT